MTIRGVTDGDLKRVLSENLTPSDSIKTQERLFGREKTLTTIDRAFASPGRHQISFTEIGVWAKRRSLNQRYLSMRKESHSRIVAGFGSGWFAFRENIMRGYVRMRAETQGIDLRRHENTAGRR